MLSNVKWVLDSKDNGVSFLTPFRSTFGGLVDPLGMGRYWDQDWMVLFCLDKTVKKSLLLVHLKYVITKWVLDCDTNTSVLFLLGMYAYAFKCKTMYRILNGVPATG